MVDDRKRTTHTDVVVIGAGLGGLCCGALLARYGYRVTICEAHSIPGGVAHSFEMDGYKFDAGPSSMTGLTDPHSTSAIRHVLDLVGEEVPCTRWERWMFYLPEGTFPAEANSDAYARDIARHGGPGAEAQWRALERELMILSEPMEGLPPEALRRDLGALLTMGRYPRAFVGMMRMGQKMMRPFSDSVDRHVRDPFLRNLMELESFIISGLLAKDTLASVMAMMWRERNKSTVDYPHGGMGGLIDGLVRGFTRYGGKLMLNADVQSILFEKGRAVGIQLKRGGRVLAKTVVSNASVWDTLPLIPEGAMPSALRDKKAHTPQTDSFLHLHVGIDAKDLPKDLESHHVSVKRWDVRAPQNVVIISIPSLLDPSLAPAGKHCVHAYLAGNEPYDVWQGLKRTQPEYEALKEQRATRLWEALEEAIPDVKKRVQTSMVGTPLTIERFCRRNRGTYGPTLVPGEPTGFPGPLHFAIPGLVHCGDSTMPGIGLPAAAASGVAAAHAIAPVWKQWQSLDELDRLQRKGHTPRYTVFKAGQPVKPITPRLDAHAP